MIRGITLFVGMYGITVTLFWVETGSLVTGLIFGLLGASLKTVWSIVHKHYYPKIQFTKQPQFELIWDYHPGL